VLSKTNCTEKKLILFYICYSLLTSKPKCKVRENLFERIANLVKVFFEGDFFYVFLHKFAFLCTEIRINMI
jgi:hypothetical protein